jgi:uncharacterized membrane protein
VQPFRQKAFYLLVWRAFLAVLVTAVLIVTQYVQFGAAILIGANVALLFSLVLIAGAQRLDDERIVRAEAWRALRQGEEPAGANGPRARLQLSA